MMQICKRLILALVAASAIACGGGDDSPTGPSVITGSAPFGTTDLVVGTSAEAAAGQSITVHYTGWLYSDSAAENKGQQIDTSLQAGRGPFAFVLGARNVIRGWDQGIPGMRVGGRRRIVIPPDLAYGATGNGAVVPPNATLLFEVELLSIQ